MSGKRAKDLRKWCVRLHQSGFPVEKTARALNVRPRFVRRAVYTVDSPLRFARF